MKMIVVSGLIAASIAAYSIYEYLSDVSGNIIAWKAAIIMFLIVMAAVTGAIEE